MLAFGLSENVHLSTDQKRRTIKTKLNNLLSRTDISENRYKREILSGLLKYLDLVEGRVLNRIFNRTNPLRVDALYEMAEILDKSTAMSDFQTAIACKVSYNKSFIDQQDLNYSRMSEYVGSAVHNYFNDKAAPKISTYQNAGLNMLVTCFVSLLFVPSYAPVHNVLNGGFILGMLMLGCSLAMPHAPDLAKLDKFFSDNPQMLSLLDNVSNCADTSLRLVNTGLNQLNRRLTNG